MGGGGTGTDVAEVIEVGLDMIVLDASPGGGGVGGTMAGTVAGGALMSTGYTGMFRHTLIAVPVIALQQFAWQIANQLVLLRIVNVAHPAPVAQRTVHQGNFKRCEHAVLLVMADTDAFHRAVRYHVSRKR